MGSLKGSGWDHSELERLMKLCLEFEAREACSVSFQSFGAAAIGDSSTPFLAYRGADWRHLPLIVDPDTDAYLCYCDGSGSPRTKTTGVGVVVYQTVDPSDPILIGENVGPGTNNYAELMAVRRVLIAVPYAGAEIVIKTDSEYAIGSVTKDWTANVHQELIAKIRADIAFREAHGGHVRLEHVSGHVGIEGNELADSLATMGRLFRSLAKWV